MTGKHPGDKVSRLGDAEATGLPRLGQGWGWAGATSTEAELERPHLCQAPGRGGSRAGVGSFGPKVKCKRIRPYESWGKVSLK